MGDGGEFDVHGRLCLSTDKSKSSEPNGMIDVTPSPGSESPTQARRVSRMQATWDKAVWKELKTPYKYKTVTVLIVHWAKHLDKDLDCGKEVSHKKVHLVAATNVRQVKELGELFEKDFKFKANILTLDDARDPQLQLRHGIDDLVLNNDGPCRTNLLIVYYTGHGAQGPGGAGLDISGSGTGHSVDPRANWNEAEKALNSAKADVLIILDCCCAGNIDKGAPPADERSFEVLAATIDEMPTEPPGNRSFTRHLIDALKEQLHKSDQSAFTTFDLNDEIIKRRKVQRSHLFRRNAPNGGRLIKLAPLDVSESENPLTTTTVTREASYLTLRLGFKYVTDLNVSNLEKLAKNMSKSAAESNLGISRIDLVDFYASLHLAGFVPFLRVVKRAQRRIRYRLQEHDRKRKRDDDEADERSIAKRTDIIADSKTVFKEGFNPISPPRSVGDSPKD